MPRPISEEFRQLLKSAIKVERKVEVYYEKPYTRATVTLEAHGEIFFSEDFNICHGWIPSGSLTELWINDVPIPLDEITYRMI
jgi:hypothetical protein